MSALIPYVGFIGIYTAIALGLFFVLRGANII